MPKRKDKSFELMASIGDAKQKPHEPLAQSNAPVEKEEKKPQSDQVKNKSTIKSSSSNIPYVPPSQAVKKQLKKIAFEEETSMTALISEGLDHVFKARGLKTIHQLTEIST